MTTFSQLVDKITLETRRPDLRADVATYVNQTLRELHFEPTRGNVIMFRDNLFEDILYADTEQGFAWDIPAPGLFQAIAGVRYDSAVDQDGNPCWAQQVDSPSRVMNTIRHWFYRVGGRVFFKGYGGLNALISLSWYQYVPSLKYYESAVRPATLDELGVATYLPAYDVDAATRLNALDLTTNWLLRRWDTVIEEGVRAKIYKRITDTERARTCYSMYQTLRQGLFTAETADVTGSW